MLRTETVDPEQEQRIAERRQRIQKRMNDANGDGNSQVQSATVSNAPAGRGEASVTAARHEMADVLGGAHSAVTNWEVAIGANENDHREREEQALEERRKMRRAELDENEVRQGAIELKFESLYKLDVPHELHKALNEQREQCGEVIAVKDKLITALKQQLEEREEEFVASLRRDAEDVNNLVNEMREQTAKYLDMYSLKLREVENTYEQERKDSLMRWDEEIYQLVKLRRTRETEYRKRREAKIAEAQQSIAEKHRENCEEYNDIKREHLQEIHTLTEELERCKAEFLLNGERLSYNLQVLRERVKENKSAQALHKRRLARLQDTLSSLVARYAESEKKYQRTNKDLTAQLHRVADQYRDLQKKFQKFEMSDKEKYRQLWRMHEEKNIQLVHKCLQADRVLFEEILGVPWNPPELNYWPSDDVGNAAEEEEEDVASSDEEIELSEEALMLLEILHKQAPFIEDENVRTAIQQVQGTSEERAVVESILSTLQIRKNEEMEDMMEFFTVGIGEDATALIRPQEAVRALSTFLTERQRKLQLQRETQIRSAEKNKQIAKIKQEERRRTAEKEYWARMADSVPKEHQRVWGALEKGLERYISQLQQRSSLIEQTDALRAQNAELRELLAQYMQSDVNYQLYIQPQLLLQARPTQ
ncbi:coiled-coil domain protein [Trypanosoma theileri]|uniref:Coiled-coil domain protein n=1 Tax=Trypanosoma theileri TaxID=67003 RepID=A0A1X0NL92_9TRYP|nr:coiled-coil domain protein [Trypanosoma theileri]ORC85542.1 coiled-coil domain protein [Trypanosoma theileri]